jgi:replicative DNA helicase
MEPFARESFPQDPSAPQPRLLRLADLLPEWDAEADAAHQAFTTGTPRGPVTGLSHLDQELGGAVPTGVNVVHGGPGVGKTALGFQIAATARCPSVFVTCEMSPLELLRRHTARVTNTFLGRLRTGEFEPAAAAKLARLAIAAAPQLAIVDATQAFASPAWISQAATVVRADGPYLLIVIDSIHAWADSAPGDGGSEYERLNAAVAALRGLAQQLACPVLGIAERNRGAMAGGGLSASAGSRKFEYSGESVWDLSRADDTSPNAAGEVEVTLKLVKNRNGAPNRTVRLLFHGALQRWREADRP